jgi:hypothetical protein
MLMVGMGNLGHALAFEVGIEGLDVKTLEPIRDGRTVLGRIL